MVDGVAVNENAVTNNSWKLSPNEPIKEFMGFSTAVDDILESYTVSPKEDEEGNMSATVLVGGGRYLVDSSVWPRLQELLHKVQEKWSEAADRWCTQEGYDQIHALLKEQRGELYETVKELIPDRHSLRTRYGLDFRTAPVQILSDTASTTAEAGRRDELVDLLEMAVRVPREAVADKWDKFAQNLVDTKDGQLVARKPVRIDKAGNSKAAKRSVPPASIASLREATETLCRAERYLDPDLLFLRNKILSELPAEPKLAEEVAKILISNDEEALRIGKLLYDAAAAARSEANMCLGLGNAIAAPTADNR
jgi:hypothetical protein